MKKGVLGFIFVTIHCLVFSQGVVIFNNGEGSFVDPISPKVTFSAGIITFPDFPSETIVPITPIPPNTVTVIFGSGGSGSSYFTGSGSGLTTPPSTASDVRSRSFSGSDYFTSSGQVMDTSFALQLGNGVNPLAASSTGIEVVPEPSSLALGVVGACLIFLWRTRRARAA